MKFIFIVFSLLSLSARAATVIPLPSCWVTPEKMFEEPSEKIQLWQTRSGEVMLTSLLGPFCSEALTLVNYSVTNRQIARQVALPSESRGLLASKTNIRLFSTAAGPRMAIHNGQSLSVFDAERLEVLSAVTYWGPSMPAGGNSNFLKRIYSFGDSHYSMYGLIGQYGADTITNAGVLSFNNSLISTPRHLPAITGRYRFDSESFIADAGDEPRAVMSFSNNVQNGTVPWLLKSVGVNSGEVAELTLPSENHPYILADAVEIGGVKCVAARQGRNIFFYSIKDLGLVKTLHLPGEEFHAFANPADPAKLMVASTQMDIYDLDSLKVVSSYPAHFSGNTCAAVAGNLRCVQMPEAGKLELLNGETGQVLESISVPDEDAYGLGLNAIGEKLYVRTGSSLVIF